jgi:XTP/dITP diphosphohydrolase
MLADLSGVPDAERGARFRTVALARFPDGSEVLAEGVVEGMISREARGERGFGYDPLFIPSDGDGRTFAQMTADEKHAISHRGRAFRALAELLAGRPVT